MVIASLVLSQLNNPSPPPLSPQGGASLAEGEEELLRRGDYAVIRSLVRVVDCGKEAKLLVDELIDRCAHMQNLREAILTYRRSLAKESDEKRREAVCTRGVEYLERYFTLCCFAAYALDPNHGLQTGTDRSFQTWMARRPELQSILRRLLWRNPLSALSSPSTYQAAPALPPGADNGETADAVVTGRSGSVLGAHCILKEEPYPGVQEAALPVLHAGAPNFRQVSTRGFCRAKEVSPDSLCSRLLPSLCTGWPCPPWTASGPSSTPWAPPAQAARRCGTTCVRSLWCTSGARPLC